jgi:hypothetical protein
MWKGALGAALLLVAAAAPVAAQDQGLDVTVAYQFQRVSCSDCGDAINAPLGFSLDAAGPLLSSLWSWVGQIDWSRKSESNVTETFSTFAAGVRWSSRQPSGAIPFLQVLLGATRDKGSVDVGNTTVTTSNTNFQFEVDGGAAFPISSDNKTSLVGQLGYRRVTQDPGLNNFRVVAGVRFNLGG